MTEFQAEDVLGSVLKEYLVGTQVQDELSKPLEKNDLEITSIEEKIDSEDRTPGSEDQNGFDHKCSKSAAELLENGNIDTEVQLQTSGELENTPQILDELSDPLKNDLEITSTQEKIDSEDRTPGSKDRNGFDHENDKSAAEPLESGNKDNEDQVQMSGELGNITTPVRKFNNVVAIVDPPRMGLHPTVSDLITFLH